MKQYLKLLMRREGKDVLGKHWQNLWLLTLVLVASFTSIAFSEGSMIYLQDKMEDPFTNWVSISKSVDNERFNNFRDSLSQPENKLKYDYAGVQMDQYTNYTMMGEKNSPIHYMETRFFEHMNTSLVSAILSESNVVEGCQINPEILDDKTLGFIITMDAAKRLGFDEKHLPAYIHFLAINEGADSLGLKMVNKDYFPVPVPVLAIVRKLPNNVDMMSANFFYEQQHYNDMTHPFDFTSNESYLHQLTYYVSDKVSIEDLQRQVFALVPDSLQSKVTVLEHQYAKSMMTWKAGKIYVIQLGDATLPRSLYNLVAEGIAENSNVNDIRRIYLLNTEEHPSPRSDFLSVEFNSLNHIRAFEAFAKENGIQLEMEQVASKENFNAVTIMGRILSSAMMVFSLICIIMFLVNMLQGYFQKVKRNMGTFKAFGMYSGELIQTYVLMLIFIVFAAVVMSLGITYLIQLSLPIIGIEKDGFNYLSLWNPTTYIAAGIVFAATVTTVCLVMAKLLRQTPGDLIYDR